MSEGIETRQDGKRGCGWRKPGGLYLVFDGPAGSCGKLPVPLDRCPTCSGGIKPTRGWTWVDSAPLFAEKDCSHSLTGNPVDSADCLTCPLAGHPGNPGSLLGRVGLLWIGGKFYSTPDAFNQEAAQQGISRRISAVPKDFVVGETWVLLAHREALQVMCPDCQGVIEAQANCATCDKVGIVPQAAIFAVFKPAAIEYVVKGDETEAEIEALRNRGITPVKVERIESEDGENEHPKVVRGTKARPPADSKTGKVWEIADRLCSNGNLPARQQVVSAAIAEGINESTAGTQYGRWRKARSSAAPTPADEPEQIQLRVNFGVSRPLPRKPHKKRERECVNDHVVIVGDAANMDDPEFHNMVCDAIEHKYPAAEGWTINGYAPVEGQ